MSQSVERPVAGLRERKKARARATIQAVALRLFREQGYDATTVQQIIDIAEVSESTFFRYFPTKADTVLTDGYDPLIAGAFLGQPSHLRPIPALRAAFSTVFAGLSEQEKSELRERTHLAISVPELRAAILDQFASAMRLLTDVLAERTGHRADDMRVRTLAGAVVGAVVAVTFAVAEDPAVDFAAQLDEAMAFLDAGLDLPPAAPADQPTRRPRRQPV